MSSFERLTEFTEVQTAEFDQIADNFHFWHRKSELPVYAELLSNIQKSIRARKATSREDVAQWLKQSETFTRSFRACHPINFSNNIIRTLTDEQLAAIKVKRSMRQQERRKRYFDETPDQRVKRRGDTILKWIGRTGLQLNDKQQAMLRETLASQISLRTQFFTLSTDWNIRLYAILDDRDSPELEARMETHLDELWHLLERAHPDEWKQNRDLWTDFALRLIKSFSGEQRTYTSGWIRKMGKTLQNVSRRNPTPNQFSEETGCSVQTLATTN